MKRFLSLYIVLSLLGSTIGKDLTPAYAQGVNDLPTPGSMVNPTPAFHPIILKGLKVYPNQPFKFDFILDQGQLGDTDSTISESKLREQTNTLIKYFLTALTVPEKDMWVNLSPYEKDRIVPESLKQSLMGQDMLAQDYLLKQLTASMIHPDRDLGKEFWDRVYAQAKNQYGTTQIPINTFNKVWIVADKANVFERNNAAYITDAHLKVMMEEDYLATTKNIQYQSGDVSNKILKELILPEIEKEVNQGKNFASLRQMFYSMILASWYKQALKESIVTQVYANQSKVNQLSQSSDVEAIYGRYLQAYKKGVFNLIKEDVINNQPVPRKYFSGGVQLISDPAMIRRSSDPSTLNKSGLLSINRLFTAGIALNIPLDPAMTVRAPKKSNRTLSSLENLAELFFDLYRDKPVIIADIFLAHKRDEIHRLISTYFDKVSHTHPKLGGIRATDTDARKVINKTIVITFKNNAGVSESRRLTHVQWRELVKVVFMSEVRIYGRVMRGKSAVRMMTSPRNALRFVSWLKARDTKLFLDFWRAFDPDLSRLIIRHMREKKPVSDRFLRVSKVVEIIKPQDKIGIISQIKESPNVWKVVNRLGNPFVLDALDYESVADYFFYHITRTNGHHLIVITDHPLDQAMTMSMNDAIAQAFSYYLHGLMHDVGSLERVRNNLVRLVYLNAKWQKNAQQQPIDLKGLQSFIIKKAEEEVNANFLIKEPKAIEQALLTQQLRYQALLSSVTTAAIHEDSNVHVVKMESVTAQGDGPAYQVRLPKSKNTLTLLFDKHTRILFVNQRPFFLSNDSTTHAVNLFIYKNILVLKQSKEIYFYHIIDGQVVPIVDPRVLQRCNVFYSKKLIGNGFHVTQLNTVRTMPSTSKLEIITNRGETFILDLERVYQDMAMNVDEELLMENIETLDLNVGIETVLKRSRIYHIRDIVKRTARQLELIPRITSKTVSDIRLALQQRNNNLFLYGEGNNPILDNDPVQWVLATSSMGDNEHPWYEGIFKQLGITTIGQLKTTTRIDFLHKGGAKDAEVNYLVRVLKEEGIVMAASLGTVDKKHHKPLLTEQERTQPLTGDEGFVSFIEYIKTNDDIRVGIDIEGKSFAIEQSLRAYLAIRELFQVKAIAFLASTERLLVLDTQQLPRITPFLQERLGSDYKNLIIGISTELPEIEFWPHAWTPIEPKGRPYLGFPIRIHEEHKPRSITIAAQQLVLSINVIDFQRATAMTIILTDKEKPVDEQWVLLTQSSINARQLMKKANISIHGIYEWAASQKFSSIADFNTKFKRYLSQSIKDSKAPRYLGAREALRRELGIFARGEDLAMNTKIPGGIDLNRSNMQLKINKENNADPSTVTISPHMLQQLQSPDFQGFDFTINTITPLPSILPILGLTPAELELAQQ